MKDARPEMGNLRWTGLALIFDTETTGLAFHPDAPAQRQPEPIEFGGILLRPDGTEVDSLSVLLRPSQPISEEIERITGLNNDMLMAAPPDALDQVVRFIMRADIAIAHNLAFDKLVIDSAVERFNSSRSAHSRITLRWPSTLICTVKEFEPLFGHNPKLAAVYEMVTGRPLDQEHRAMSDCRALAEICRMGGVL